MGAHNEMGVTCMPVRTVDEDCVRNAVVENLNRTVNNLGYWSLSNTCQTTVVNILAMCAIGADDWE